MKQFILYIGLILITFSFKSDNPAYKIYNKAGKKASYNDLIKAAKKADVVFFGELHNNPIAHWMELELTKAMYNHSGDKLVLGAEMYEADDQIIIDEYLADKYSYKSFKPEMKLWPNNSTDYQPLLDFAKDSSLKFIATNVPRRYANLVFRRGFESLDSLTDDAKRWIAPLPINYDPTLPAYVEMMEMMGGHGGDNLPKAQAIKDATMAHFISMNFKQGEKFLHYNGSYHSDNYQGIVWYLQKYRPELKIMVISCVEQTDVDRLEDDYLGIADYIICIPESMTKTY